LGYGLGAGLVGSWWYRPLAVQQCLLAALAVELGLATLRVAPVHLDQDIDQAHRGPGGLGYLWDSVSVGSSRLLDAG